MIGPIWGIWNEPNIFFWQPKPDVQQYNALALATCRAVRQADPRATIIGPATSGVPAPFLEAFLASGVLPYLDAVSVHPYRLCQPARRPDSVAMPPCRPSFRRFESAVCRSPSARQIALERFYDLSTDG